MLLYDMDSEYKCAYESFPSFLKRNSNFRMYQISIKIYCYVKALAHKWMLLVVETMKVALNF